MPAPPQYQQNVGGSNMPSSSGMNNNAAGGQPPYESVPSSQGPLQQQPPPPSANQNHQQRMPMEKPQYMPQGMQPQSMNDMNPNTPLYQLIETTKNDPEYNRNIADSECSALIEFSLDAFFYQLQAEQSKSGKMIIPDKEFVRNQVRQVYDKEYAKQEPDASRAQMMQQQQQQQQQQHQARLQQQRQAQMHQMQQQQQQGQRPQRPMHSQMQTVGSGGFTYVGNASTSSAYPPNWNGSQGVPPGNMHVRPMMQQQQMRHPGPYPVQVQQQQQQGPAGRSPYYGDQPGPSNGHPSHPPPNYQNQPMMSPAYQQGMNPSGPPSAGPPAGGFSRQASFQDPYSRQPASMVPPPQNMVKQEVLSRPGSSGEATAMKHSPADFNSPGMSNGTMNSGDPMHGSMFSPKNGLQRQPQMMPPRNSPQIRNDMMSPPVHMTKNGLMSPQVMGDAQQSPMQANGIEALRQGGPQNVSPLVAATPPNNNESPNCPKLLAALSKSGDIGVPNGETTLLAANPRKRASEDDKQKPKRTKLDERNMPYQNMLQFVRCHFQNEPRSLLRHICELLLEHGKPSKRALEWKEGQQRVFTVSKPRVFSDRWKTALGETESKSITYTKMENELLKNMVKIGGCPILVKVDGGGRDFQFFPGFMESPQLKQNATSIGVDNMGRLVEYPAGHSAPMPMQQQPHMQHPHQQMMYQGAPPNGAIPPPNGGVPPNANGRYLNMQQPQPPPQHFAPAPIKTA